MATDRLVIDYTCYLSGIDPAEREQYERSLSAAVLNATRGASVALRHDGAVTVVAIDFAVRRPAAIDRLTTGVNQLRGLVRDHVTAAGGSVTEGNLTIR